jgi:hypothetical protein
MSKSNNSIKSFELTNKTNKTKIKNQRQTKTKMFVIYIIDV